MYAHDHETLIDTQWEKNRSTIACVNARDYGIDYPRPDGNNEETSLGEGVCCVFRCLPVRIELDRADAHLRLEHRSFCRSGQLEISP